MPAVVFDLDETLLDTGMLRQDRRPGRWRHLARRLGEARRYAHAESLAQADEAPARARAMGFDVGVLTRSPRWYAERLLAAFDIPFDALITGSDGYPPKPDPSSLLALAREIGVSPADCIVVGDEGADIAAAQGAGATSIGVAWSGRAPRSWRRRWPDIAVAQPDVLIEALESPGPRRAYGEAFLDRDRALWHWGSLLRFGDGICGAGRYFTTIDSRQPGDAVSRLILDAKQDQRAAERAGELLANLLAAGWKRAPIDLITSVPAKPGESFDRFAAARARISAMSGVAERGDVLSQCFDDPDYKHQRAADRRERTRGRFSSARLGGQRVLLIDDVVTSGGQAEACRRQMLAQGASKVTVLAIGVTQDALPRACPTCGGILRLVTSGPHGPFIGCSNYFRSDCRYTEPAPPL